MLELSSGDATDSTRPQAALNLTVPASSSPARSAASPRPCAASGGGAPPSSRHRPYEERRPPRPQLSCSARRATQRTSSSPPRPQPPPAPAPGRRASRVPAQSRCGSPQLPSSYSAATFGRLNIAFFTADSVACSRNGQASGSRGQARTLYPEHAVSADVRMNTASTLRCRLEASKPIRRGPCSTRRPAPTGPAPREAGELGRGSPRLSHFPAAKHAAGIDRSAAKARRNTRNPIRRAATRS
jgi:hypothetical protein